MAEMKTVCGKCGAAILQTTANDTGGLCVPCKEGRRVQRRCEGRDTPAGRHADWMCIPIEKDAETAAYADYFFSADVSDKDPRFRNRTMIVGQERGLLRILKHTGEIQLLYPMAGDVENKRFNSAAIKVKKAWEAGELPDRMLFACG